MRGAGVNGVGVIMVAVHITLLSYEVRALLCAHSNASLGHQWTGAGDKIVIPKDNLCLTCTCSTVTKRQTEMK
jgi:hypothetical protein